MIVNHLQECDFCCAELQLITAHEAFEENVQLPEIPLPLKQLAEALLGGKQSENVVLSELLSRTEAAQLTETTLGVY